MIPGLIPGLTGTLDDWAAARLGLSAPLTREALESCQIAGLRETVARARVASPFYRARRDWSEGPLESLEDLARLPFTTADDLGRADPSLLAIPQSAVARVVTQATSGTSGPPKRICCAAEDLEATVDFFHHGLELLVRPGELVVIDFPDLHPASLGELLVQAVQRLDAVAVPVARGTATADLPAFLRAHDPGVILGTPMRLLAAARLSAQDRAPPLRLRTALASADSIPAALAPALRRHWNCELFTHWGMTETGFGGAVECRFHTGQHLRETDLLVEIIDPASGARLPPGAEGEIVVTTLRRRAMPLIRYRTGDFGRILEGPCACGSVLRRLAPELRRADGAAPLPGGGTLSLVELDALLELEPLTDLAATLEAAPPAVLRLTLGCRPGLRSEALRETARARAAALPALRRAVESGALALDVNFAGEVTCGRGGKRRIVQRRALPEAWAAPIRAVLFDLDGTLIDSLGEVRDALDAVLAEAGLPSLPPERLRRIVGGGAEALLERAFAAVGSPLDGPRRQAALEGFLARYRPREARFTRLCRGAGAAVARLAACGVKLAVVSNRGEADAAALLARFGLAGAMQAVIGGDAGLPKKPAPDLLLLACARLGVGVAETVVVGDSDYDIEAARAAAMRSVAVRGGCSARGTDRLGADRVIDGLDGLVEILCVSPEDW